MAMDVLSTIRSGMSGFSKRQKRIGAFILSSYDKAAFMTAHKLGQATEVSESTVVRFAAVLGFDGYPEMQKALQEEVRTHLTSVQRIDVSNSQMENQDLVSMVLQSDINALRLTGEMLDAAVMDAAADAILRAKNVYIIGVHSSAVLAQFLNFYLRFMMGNVHLIDPSATGEILEQLLHAGTGDAVIAISLPRYSRRTVRALEFVRQAGANCIAITDNYQAPIARLSGHVLIARSSMVSFVDSLVAPMSVINALVVAVSRKLGREFSDIMAERESLWDKRDIYEQFDR